MTKGKTLFAILLVLGILFNITGCIQTDSNEENVIEQPTVDDSPIDLGKFVVVCEYDGEINKSQNEMVFEHVKKEILEDYNYIIDGEFIYLSSATFVEELKSMFAQGKTIDGICASNEVLSNYITNEYLLMDVKPLLQKYGVNIKEFYSEEDLLKTKVNSKYIGIPDMALNQKYYTVVKSDVIEELDSEVPTTYSELVKFCEEVLDEGLASYPIGLTLQQIKRSWSASWSMPSEVFVDDEGEIWPVEYHDNYHRFLEDIKYLYKNKYVSEDFATVLNEEQRENFFEGKSVIYEINYDESYDVYDEIIKVDEDARLQVVKNIMVNGISENLQINDSHSDFQSLYFLTSGTGQEALMVFKDYTGATRENYLSIVFGIEYEHFEIGKEYNSIIYPKSPYSLNQIYSGELLINTGFDLIYPPVILENTDDVLKLSNDLDVQAYDYLSSANVINEGISFYPNLLSDEAMKAKLNYYMKVNEGIIKYIQGSIKFSEFQLLLEDLKPLARLWCDQEVAS